MTAMPPLNAQCWGSQSTATYAITFQTDISQGTGYETEIRQISYCKYLISLLVL